MILTIGSEFPWSTTFGPHGAATFSYLSLGDERVTGFEIAGVTGSYEVEGAIDLISGDVLTVKLDHGKASRVRGGVENVWDLRRAE